MMLLSLSANRGQHYHTGIGGNRENVWKEGFCTSLIDLPAKVCWECVDVSTDTCVLHIKTPSVVMVLKSRAKPGLLFSTIRKTTG